MFGLAMKIHAIVCRIPGIISGTSDAAYISGLNGTSVRTTRNASNVPSVIASAVDPNANANELTVIVPRPTVVYAPWKFAHVRCPLLTNVCQKRNPSGTSARYATIAATPTTITLRAESRRRQALLRENTGRASAGAATSPSSPARRRASRRDRPRRARRARLARRRPHSPFPRRSSSASDAARSGGSACGARGRCPGSRDSAPSRRGRS